MRISNCFYHLEIKKWNNAYKTSSRVLGSKTARAHYYFFLLLEVTESNPHTVFAFITGVTRLTDSKTISGTLKRKTSPRMDDFSAWQGRGMQLKGKPWSTQWGASGKAHWREPVFRGDPCGWITPASPLAVESRVSRSLAPQPYKSRPCSQTLRPQPVNASEVWPVTLRKECLQPKEQRVLKTQGRTSRYTWQPNRGRPPEANTSGTQEPCAGLWGGDSRR